MSYLDAGRDDDEGFDATERDADEIVSHGVSYDAEMLRLALLAIYDEERVRVLFDREAKADTALARASGRAADARGRLEAHLAKREAEVRKAFGVAE